MADPISGLNGGVEIVTIVDADQIAIVDKSDLSQAPTGTTKPSAMSKVATYIISKIFGTISVTRSTGLGIPTFFTDLQTALDTCKAAGSHNVVTFYDDIVATNEVFIDFLAAGGNYECDSLTIDFNGFKLTRDNVDADSTLKIDYATIASSSFKVKLLQGRIERLNGTTASNCIDTLGNGSIIMDNMFCYNDTGLGGTLDNDDDTSENGGYNDLGGSIFSGLEGGLVITGGKFQSFTGICRLTVNGFGFYGVKVDTASAKNFFGYAEFKEGVNVLGSTCTDFTGFSENSIGVRVNNTQPDELCSHFVGRSNGTLAHAYGVFGDTGAIFNNFKAYSNGTTQTLFLGNGARASNGLVVQSGAGEALNSSNSNVVLTNTTILAKSTGKCLDGSGNRKGTYIGCTFIASSNEAIRVLYGGGSVPQNKFINCFIKSEWNNAAGHAYVLDSDGTLTPAFTDTLSGCTLQVTNASANCILGASTLDELNFGNCGFIGATTATSNVTNTANTTDSQGNISL